MIGRPNPVTPHYPGVSLGDPLHVTDANGKGGGAPSGSGSAMDSAQILITNVEIAAKRGDFGVDLP